MHYVSTFNLFAEEELNQVLQSKIREMEAEINSQPDDYILNVNETEYINYLLKKYSIENVELKFDDLFISTYEKDIPAESLVFSQFWPEPGQKCRKDVVKYHIPFIGYEKLLYFTPNSRLLWTTKVSIEDGCLCFDIINFYNDSQQIKREADGIINNIKRQTVNVDNEINAYNDSLIAHTQQIFQARKQHLLTKNNLLASLGVPIKKREGFSQTFAIPTPQKSKKIQITQPVVTEKGYKPEPTLELSVYQEILQVIHDVGKQFERMPSTYANKHEEELRDHILLVLEPRFEGSATGETFNKKGKTDILLRYQGSNVFIGECKFWKGAKVFIQTITQLLGYLTWRDSKAAVVIFVQNKDFSSIIKTVEQEVVNHPNFLGFVSKKEETWLNYRFHINNDSNREVKLAVLLFHIPNI